MIAAAAATARSHASQLAACRSFPTSAGARSREPVFPPDARTVLTNSGKYAHYGPGLSGRAVRLGSLDDCVEAAVSGRAAPSTPRWLGS